MLNHELIKELLLQGRKLPVRLELINHDDVTIHYSPIYSVRLASDGEVVISGIPPEILKKLQED